MHSSQTTSSKLALYMQEELINFGNFKIINLPIILAFLASTNRIQIIHIFAKFALQ